MRGGRARRSCVARAVAALALPIMLAACAPAPQSVRESFVEPPVILARSGVAHFALTAVVDPATKMPAFSYGGILGAAPTVRVHRGDLIRIDYRNALPRGHDMESATNLHFHGLVVAPHAPGDETLHTMAMPGQVLHYAVRIGRTQQPGLYWYHPHAHGNTFKQVGRGGMSGAIVVEGLEREVPAFAALRERLLVVRDVADDLAINALRDHPELAPDSEDGGPNEPCRRTAGTHLTLNGAIAPTIGFAPAETQFFRLLNATATRFLDVSLPGAALRAIAYDGVALGAYPGAAPSVPFTHMVLAPGARLEFTVAHPPAGARLTTACFDSGPDGDADPADVLATIVSDTDARPLPEHAPARPESNPLAVPLPVPVRERRVTFDEYTRNGKSFFKINGAAYAPQAAPVFQVRSGTIERWVVSNDTREAHAFHIHQVHFSLRTIDGVAQAPYWRDTMTTPPASAGPGDTLRPSRTVMLVDFRDPVVRGTFVFHCHLLDHEDGGMMAKINVR